MYRNYYYTSEGQYPKPSARKSIHEHIEISHDLNMSGNCAAARVKSAQRDIDEVDNVMSKFTRHVNKNIQIPKYDLKNTYNRSGSLNDVQSSDDESELLSKSVPTTLPSYSYSSDDSDTAQVHNEDEINNSSYRSFEDKTINNSNNNISFESSQLNVHNFQNTQRYQSQTKNENNKFKIVLSGVITTVILAAVFKHILNTQNVSNIIYYDKLNFYKDIINLGQKYNIGRNPVLQVQSGISTIFDRRDTGSFIFIYNSDTEKFDLDSFNDFIHDISFTTAKYLRNDSMPLQYTAVEVSNLDMKEHSELIDKYRDHLDKTGVMLVKQMEKIPSTLAMAFHYYCDEYSPLVEKSAIFFTLDLAKCSPSKGHASNHAQIEKCLTKKWTSVPLDNIGPLLTRVVSIVIDLTSVF